MLRKWGKVSLRGRAQVISHEPLLSLHHSPQSALFGLFHHGESGFALAEVYTGDRLELGNRHSEHLPRVTFSFSPGVFNSAEQFTAF